MEGIADTLFTLAGSLTQQVRSYLELKVLEEGTEIEAARTISTTSPEACRHYINGLEKFWGRKSGISDDLRMAISLDTSFTEAYIFLSLHNTLNGNFTRAKTYFQKADQHKNRLSENMRLWHEALRSSYFDKNPYRSIEYLRKAAELNPLSRASWFWLGLTYIQSEEYSEALETFNQILKLNKRLGPWRNVDFYSNLVKVLIKFEKYHREKKSQRG
jgi:tetratricopeptide (TPR) repeat protein